MQEVILIIHVLACLLLIVLVLLQHGKGADAGATFGAGGANTMFGAEGSTPFLVKLTAILAAVFFATSLSLTYIAAQENRKPAVSQQSLTMMPGPVTSTDNAKTATSKK